MNSEPRTTILLDALANGDDDEVVYSMMRVRVDCLRRATCPGCSHCNDQTLASRHSATRIHDMEISRQQYPRVKSDEAKGYTTVYKRKPHQVQTNPGSHTLDMNLSRMHYARVREDEANGNATVYRVDISQMETDAALARQLNQDDQYDNTLADMRSFAIEYAKLALARELARELGQTELVADRLMEETDAALARQLHHEEMRVESDAAVARQLRDR